jgi:hypothetical protein
MRLKIINRLNRNPFATPFKRSLPTADSQDEKVTIHSVIGDKEANWHIDRYKVTVVISIVSVVAITGAILWLASGGGKDANAASPYPTGELQFNDGKAGKTINDIPYPSVRQSEKRLMGSEISDTPAQKKPSVTPTVELTPTPTSTPAPTVTTVPTPTSTPALTATPTPTQAIIPTTTQAITPSP